MTDPTIYDPMKRVFISYRTEPGGIYARLLERELDRMGLVGLLAPDYLGAGPFAPEIFRQIETSEHFVLILVPKTLDGCNIDSESSAPQIPDPTDWIRKEVEHALETGRNIIPTRFDNYSRELIVPKLTAGMKPIADLQFAHLVTNPKEILQAYLDLLRDKFLSKPALKPTAPLRHEIINVGNQIQSAVESQSHSFRDFESERLITEANVHFEKGDISSAIELYTDLVMNAPDWHIPLYNRAVAHMNVGNYQEAIDDFSEAISIAPNFLLAYFNRGCAHSDFGNQELAIRDFEHVWEKDKRNVAPLINKGISLSLMHNHDEALELLKKAIELSETHRPLKARAYFNRGVIYQSLGNYYKAIADFTQAILLLPSYFDAINNRGVAYIHVGDFSAALEDFNTLIELKSDYPRAFLHRGQTFLAMQKYEKAINDFTKSIKSKFDIVDGYMNRGVARYHLGKYDESLSDYQNALALRRDYPGLYVNMAELQFVQEDFLDAKENFKKAYTLQTDFLFAKAGLGIVYYALGETIEAHTLWQQLIEKDERHMDAEWVGKEYKWADPLTEEARKLIASLKDADNE